MPWIGLRRDGSQRRSQSRAGVASNNQESCSPSTSQDTKPIARPSRHASSRILLYLRYICIFVFLYLWGSIYVENFELQNDLDVVEMHRQDPQTKTLGVLKEKVAFRPASLLPKRNTSGWWSRGNRLHILEARMHALPSPDHRVQLTIFGFPGADFVKAANETYRVTTLGQERLAKRTCLASSLEQKARLETMWGKQDLENFHFFVTLECDTNKGERTHCDRALPLLLLPQKLLDSHQRDATFLFQADLSSYLSLETLWKHALDQQGFRVSLWAQPRWSENTIKQDSASFYKYPIAIVMVQLSTINVVGKMQLWASSTTLLGHTPGAVKPSSAEISRTTTGSILCIPLFEDHLFPESLQLIKNAIPEFTQHHLNVGFDQIVFGMLSTSKDGAAKMYETIVASIPVYGASDQVLWQPTVLDDWNCEINILKSAFLNSCLYHAKGHARYVGVWDLDEFWIPPKIDANAREPEGTIDSLVPYLSDNAQGSNPWVSDSPDPTVNASWVNRVSRLWINSNYSTIPSVTQVMDAVQAYQEAHGCGDEWCFHAFGSWMVHPTTPASSGPLTQRYQHRDSKQRAYWHKSIAMTSRTHVVALHEFGSCPSPAGRKEPWLDTYSVEEFSFWRNKTYGTQLSSRKDGRASMKCQSLTTYDEGSSTMFGSLHHFYTLLGGIRRRIKVPPSSTLVVDEYLERYGRSVNHQLKIMGRYSA